MQTKRIQITLDANTVARLDALAAEYGMPRSAVVSMMVVKEWREWRAPPEDA